MRDFIHAAWLSDLADKLESPDEKIPLIREWTCKVIDELMGEFEILHFVMDDYITLLSRIAALNHFSKHVVLANSMVAAREHLMHTYGFSAQELLSLSA